MTTTAYERLHDALVQAGRTVKDNGHGKCVAQCPAHDDGNPSLSVTGIEGSVLLYCHAGCEIDDVLAALNLAKSDLFDNRRDTTYEYPGGRVVRRRANKQFPQSGNKADRTLFRADRVADADHVLVVEGEKDVLAAEAVGAAAVCSAMGAGKAHLADWTPLAGKRVTVVADNDDPGRKHAAQVVAELGKVGAAEVRIARAAAGKDLADHIAAGKAIAELIDVRAGAGRVARVEWATNIRPERQVWLWDTRIPVGTVSALAGRGGCGKTTYALHLAAKLSLGQLPGQHYGQPASTLVWSGEDQWAPVLVPRLIAAGADLNLIGRLHIEAEDGIEVTPRLPLDVATLREAITVSGAALVIIDPIASTMTGDLHREDDVRVALDALARVAADTGAVVMFVRHFGKGGGNASDKMSGSHAFRDAVRSVFLFAQDEDDGCVVVTQDKGNYAPPGEESFAFRLESFEVPTDDGPANVARVVDLGASEVSVGDIINRPPGSAIGDEEDERDYTADFRASWLYLFLAAAGKANHPVRPKDAVAYAADQGISRATVFRLFDKLANAGLAVSRDTGEFPKVTHWALAGETTGSTHHSGETTETTGLDLRKQGETTGGSPELVRLQGETTGATPLELREYGASEVKDTPESPVVSPTPSERQQTDPPGGLTATSPGQTDRVARALANAARQVATA